MAKVICCRDVGVDCDFKASGGTVEEGCRHAHNTRTRRVRMAWTPFHRNWLEKSRPQFTTSKTAC